MVWITDIDLNRKYELYIGSQGGILAPEDSSFLFALDWWYTNFSNTSFLDVSNLDVSNVTNMNQMFRLVGSNRNIDTIIIKGLETWDVSNVLSMESMFRDFAPNA